MRVTRRRAQTRARLLEAAFTVFAARGFGQASIEEVCEAAGYTRGAFYSNFASLEELFFALYESRAGRLAGQVADVLGGLGGDAAIATLVEGVVEALQLDRDWLLVRTDFLLHAARTPGVAPQLASHRTAVRDALAATVAPVSGRPDLPASLRSATGLADAVITVHDGVTLQLLLDADPAPLRAWLRDLLTTLLDRPDAPR